MPICTTCKIEKNATEFSKDRRKKSGLRCCCKACQAAYRQTTKDYHRAYAEANRERLRALHKQWRDRNPERLKSYEDKLSDEKKAEKKACRQRYYQENKASIYAKQREYKAKNVERIREISRESAQRLKEQRNEKSRVRFASDPLYAMSYRARNRIRYALKRGGYKKNSASAEILGCDWDTFKRHIESQFRDGMSWDNMKEWHLDHIIPLSSAKSEEEILRLVRYENIRPLWAHQNLSKGAKLDDHAAQYQTITQA